MNNIDHILPIPKHNYRVLVRCFTYNQSAYIQDALNGFVMQKTNFPFVCLVMDDASTDGEQDVLRRWMESECDMSRAEIIDIQTSVVIIAPHKNNTFCSFAFYLLKQNLYNDYNRKLMYVTPWREKCKYEAMCEGDDYWIDPLKLQKQVDFLEANPEYGMCYSNFNIYFQQTGITWYDNFTKRPDKFPMKYNTPEEFILRKGYVCPPSWLYRKESLPKSTLESLDGTFVWFTHFLCTTKVFVFMDVMATYRVCAESASHSADYEKLYRRSWNLYTTQCKLIDCYKLDHELKKRCEINFFKENLVQFILHDKKDDIVRAKKVLSGLESARDRILFFLTNVPGGKYLLQLVYYCRSIVR